MIIAPKFPNDENIPLMKIQIDVYQENMGFLFRCPRDRFIEAARMLRVTNDLIEILKEKDSFDHRVLQEAHDLIAARFRFDHFCGGQMPIPFDEKKYNALMGEEWVDFYYQEARNIAAYDFHISWEIVNAVAFQNLDKGLEAEKRLNSNLRDKYSFIFKKKPFKPEEI